MKPSEPTAPPAWLPYCWMLGGALAFAAMAFIASRLGAQCPWQWIAIARTGFALLFATILCLAAGARMVFFRPATLWMRSIAGSVSLVGGFYAMTHYPVSEVLTLTNMFPLWVAVLSWPMLREQPSMEVWAAMVVGIIGVAVMQQRPEEAVVAFSFLPVPIAVLSSFTSAIALIGLHRLREIDSRAIVVHFSGVALGFCILSLFIFPQTATAAAVGMPGAFSKWEIGGMLLAMGIFATIGQLLLTKAFAAGPPAKISVVGLSQVAFAMLFEMSLAHRTFGPVTLLGIALVISPTIWILLRRSREGTANAAPREPSGEAAGR